MFTKCHTSSYCCDVEKGAHHLTAETNKEPGNHLAARQGREDGVPPSRSQRTAKGNSVPGRGNRKRKGLGAGVFGVSGEWHGSQSSQVTVGRQDNKK